MKVWCLEVHFPDECKIRHFKLSKETPEIFVEKTHILLLQWLTDIAAMAVHYANIAYGKSSLETNVFNEILNMWTTSYNSSELHVAVYKDGNESGDYYKNHMATRDAISSLI